MGRYDFTEFDPAHLECRLRGIPVDPSRARRIVERTGLHPAEAPITCPQCAEAYSEPGLLDGGEDC